MAFEKSDIRKKMLDFRDVALSPVERNEMRERVTSCFVNDLLMPASVRSVGLYYPIRNEMDTLSVFEFCLQQGIECLFPLIISEHDMRFFPVHSKQELVKKTFGIYEPHVSCYSGRGHSTPDVLVVPGVAFDEDNHRVGYGKGFYDRYISADNPLLTVGFAYEFQIVESIKVESWDVRLDLVLTENGWRGDFKKISAGGFK